MKLIKQKKLIQDDQWEIDKSKGEIENHMYRGRKKIATKREKLKQRNLDERSKKEQIREISMYQQRGRHEKEGNMKINKISF